MPLAVAPGPFDSPEWIFEVKYDGFRALAYASRGAVHLVSRKANSYKSFASLCSHLASVLPAETVLDGEIVCLDATGKPAFYELLRRRAETYFFAFDCLWHDGRDLRQLSLIERKRILKTIIPKSTFRLCRVEHAEQTGIGLFAAACDMDLEGLVAKWKHGPYLQDLTDKLGQDQESSL